MKKLLLLMAMLLAMSGSAWAQVEPCPGCVLGLYDAENLSQNYGNFGSFTKTIYLGIKYDPNSTFDSCTGVEFSIQGLPATALPPQFNIRDGGFAVGPATPVSPPDTTAVDAIGGWNVTWTECQPGNKVLVEIVIISLDPLPENTVIRVLRKIDPGAPHQVLLVLDATTGQNALNQVEVFKDRAGVTGLIMTKLDGTARGGILVAISAKFGLPVHAIGIGEGVEELSAFDAGEFARAIALG